MEEVVGLALEDGEEAFVHVQHDQVAGGSVDGMDLSLPGAVTLLFAHDAREALIAEGAPLIIALTVNDLAIVQVGVVPMTKGLVFGHDFV